MAENCEKPKNSMGNGAKSTIGIVGALALVAGAAAVVRPISERVTSLEDRLVTAIASLERQHAASFDRIEEQIADHKGLYGHPAAQNAVGRLEAMFAEVEAQFRGDRGLSAEQQTANERRLAELERSLKDHDRQIVSERGSIKALERQVFNGAWKQDAGQAPGVD